MLSFLPTDKLDALDGIIIPISVNDWTPQNRQGMSRFWSRDRILTYLNADDYRAAMSPPNAPLVSAPVDPSVAFHPWLLMPGTSPQGISYLTIRLDDSGNPVKQDLTPASGGITGANPPETMIQPGGTTGPSLTTQVYGQGFPLFMAEYGGHFANGIPAFWWVQSTEDNLRNPNFAGSTLAQLPLGWYSPLTPNDFMWDRRYVAYIAGSGKVRVVSQEDVRKLGKYGAPTVTTVTPRYLNDDVTTYNIAAGMLAAVAGGVMTTAQAGAMINASARRTA